MFHDTYGVYANFNGGVSLYRLILPYIEKGVEASMPYANATPVKTFICPSRRTSVQPWADYAGSFTISQQMTDTDAASDPTLAVLRRSTTCTVFDVPGAMGKSVTLT